MLCIVWIRQSKMVILISSNCQSSSVSRHYFLKSRSGRSEVSVSSRHLEVSENGHLLAIFKGPFQN